MIKHIVMWTLSAEDALGKDQAASEIEAAFAGMGELIPEIGSLEIVRNVVPLETNWDLALVSEFETAEGLAAYIAHPVHQAAVVIVRARVASRAAIDYEI